jgi:hypothetical protein
MRGYKGEHKEDGWKEGKGDKIVDRWKREIGGEKRERGEKGGGWGGREVFGIASGGTNWGFQH